MERTNLSHQPKKSNLTANENVVNKSIPATTSDMTPSMDFNQAHTSLNETSVPVDIPVKHTTTEPIEVIEPIEIHETIGHFQVVLPSSNGTVPPRQAAPDPSYGIFNSNLNDVYNSNNTWDIPPSELTPPLRKINDNNWQPSKDFPDSVVQFSDVRPVYILPTVNSDTQQSVQAVREPVSHIVDIEDEIEQNGDHAEEFIGPYLDRREGSSMILERTDILNTGTGDVEESNIGESYLENTAVVSYLNQNINTTSIVPTLPSKRINWETKMGAILGLPAHMMPDKSRKELEMFNNEKHGQEELHRDDESSELLPASRSDANLKENTPSDELSSSSSFYPMKIDTAYPDLGKYSSINVNNRQPHELTSPDSYLYSPTSIPHNHYIENFNYQNPQVSSESTNNWYDHKVGLSEPGSVFPYEGPPIVGYGEHPYKNHGHDSASMLGHFWDTYNSSGSVPRPHDDRGPVPEDTKIIFVHDEPMETNRPTPQNIHPPPSVRGSVPYNTAIRPKYQNNPSRRLWSENAEYNSNLPSFEQKENEFHNISPPASDDYYHTPPPRRNGPSHSQPPRRSEHLNIQPIRRNGPFDSKPLRKNGQPSSQPPRRNSQSNFPPPRRHGSSNAPPLKRNEFVNMPSRQPNPPTRINNYSHPPESNNHRNSNTRLKEANLPNSALTHRNGLPSRPPQNSFGPLQGIYDYSTRIANSLLNFPNEIAMLMKNSTDEYLSNTIDLLQDYNKIFDNPEVSPEDVLPDMYDSRPNRNERLVLPGIEQLRSLDPFEMSLITWTFLDFWEFLIEKVGTLSRNDLDVLQNRLEKLRSEKNSFMARALVNATMYHLSVDNPIPNIFNLPDVKRVLSSLRSIILDDPDATAIIDARMLDPFGLFNSEQRVQFIQFAVKVLLRFGRVYLQKSYALDCMMLLFCKELNQHTKKQGIDGLSAKLKTVGLKVLTDREERETDTIGDIWRAISAFSPLHCDVMFPKCDGSKALEIVNDVASGSN